MGVNGGKTFSLESMSCPRTHLGQWRREQIHPPFTPTRTNPGPANDYELADESTDPASMFRRELRRLLLRLRLERGAIRLRNAVNAERADGASSPTAAAVAAPWWLDVETGNKWQTLLIRAKFCDGHLRRSVDRRHDRLIREHRYRVCRDLLDVSAVGRHHRSHRVIVPSRAGVARGLRLPGDGGSGLWSGVLHWWARGPHPVRFTRLRRRLRLRTVEHATSRRRSPRPVRRPSPARSSPPTTTVR